MARPPAQLPALGVAIATRNRRETLVATLGRLRQLPERPPVVVADNGSRDGTVAAVRALSDPGVTVLPLGANRGAAGRNAAAAELGTPLVAFCDDDSWFAPGALARAAAQFAALPRLGLLAARVLVEPEGREDPVSTAMRHSPLLPGPRRPGPGVLGFVACGAVVRREAFLGCGGFEPRFGVGGEEALLALDLRAAGWETLFDERVVAHHAPHRGRRPGRTRSVTRNDLWTAWLRDGWPQAIGASAGALGRAATDLQAAAGVADAVLGARWALRHRRPLPPHLQRERLAVRRAGA